MAREPGLELKAFGKDGVRLCWTRPAAAPEGKAAPLHFSYRPGGEEEEWRALPLAFEAEGPAGVQTVRSSGELPCPRDVVWRCECDGAVSAPARLLRPQRREAERAGPQVLMKLGTH